MNALLLQHREKILAHEMQIFVRTPSSTKIFNISSKATPKDIFPEGIKSDSEWNFVSHRLLDKCKPLSEQGIQEMSTIYMVPCLMGGAGEKQMNENDATLARKRKEAMICRGCYARLAPRATNCRKRKCGHSSNLRPKKKIKENKKGK